MMRRGTKNEVLPEESIFLDTNSTRAMLGGGLTVYIPWVPLAGMLLDAPLDQPAQNDLLMYSERYMTQVIE
jgi:hypothetical protein